MVETHPFPLFIPHHAKYLLLGSFTANSVTTDSNYNWYYGSKRNQFWQLLEKVYEVKLPTITERKSLFEKLQLGIGDLIYSCEREHGNSADTNLINIVFNSELKDILNVYVFERIYFSSKYVSTLFKRNFEVIYKANKRTCYITLPSPSPRYALMSKEQKIQRYRELLPPLYETEGI